MNSERLTYDNSIHIVYWFSMNSIWKMLLSIVASLFMNMSISSYTAWIENIEQQNSVLKQYISQIIENKHIEIIRWANRTVEYPERAKPDVDYKNQAIEYRMNDVLPFSEDRDKDAYIVYPKLGVIVPVLTINEDDKKLIREKKWFDHYKYLEWWSLHYVWNSPSQWDGNMVIAGHSSFFSNDPGKYKTAFQAVALSDIGDNIWYFEKNNKWIYDRYDYIIDIIDQVSTKDTSILYPKNTGKELTTYTCYPFWSTANRKFNKASFVAKREWSVLAKKANTSIDQTDGIQKKLMLAKSNTQIHWVASIKNKPKKTRTLQFRKAKWIKNKLVNIYKVD